MKPATLVGELSADPGHKVKGFLQVSGTEVQIPLTLVNGREEGLTLPVTAGIHGGEYASIEAAIRFASGLDPVEVRGQVLVLPLVSPEAFHARVQYLLPADGKNVNRQFPGRALGTISERIAYTVVHEVARQASAWIDLHGGDIHEALVPVVGYLEEGTPEVQERARAMAEVFGLEHVMHPSDLPGTTFKAAVAMGIPCIIAEAGQCGQMDEPSVRRLVDGCTNVARHLGILPGTARYTTPVVTFRDYPWVRSRHVGCWYPAVQVGQCVRRGERVGVIKDYFGTHLAEYTAPADGMILLLATSLAMNAGDPLFGLGIR
jgi:predicted deacylase